MLIVTFLGLRCLQEFGMIYNFGAGPAMLPAAVMQRIKDEFTDWEKGMSVLEANHRGDKFTHLAHMMRAKIGKLLAVPASHEILLVQGGARLQFAMLPLNFLQEKATYVISGYWSKLAAEEAAKHGNIALITNAKDMNYQDIPEINSALVDKGDYLHYVDNETIHGIEFTAPPIAGLPLAVDMTSSILTKSLDIALYDLVYASAQKNLGIAGFSLVIINKDLLERSLAPLSYLNYKTWHNSDSMYSTPATFSWFVADLMLDWLIEQGGVAKIEQINHKKATKLYQYIDSSDMYYNSITPAVRSRINIPFNLHNKNLNNKFLEAANENGLLQLRGHKMVGGMRASIYNAMPESGVDKLIEFMQLFEKQYT